MTRAENWLVAAGALCRAWKPLVGYELLMSLVMAAVLGPLVATCTYHAVGLSGDAVLGNFELVSFLLSPLGALALVLFGSVGFALVFFEYAGLILLADAALDGLTVSAGTLARALVWAAPRLFALALIQTALALLAALPFMALGGAVYWLLLSDADIHYFLAERPPRFWAAVGCGIALTVGFAIVAVWLFARWALAVPVCVVESHSILGTLAQSSQLMRGRVARVITVLGGWQLAKYVAFAIAVALLNVLNVVLLDRFAGRLTSLVWLTALLLLVDGLVLQLLAAVFAIGMAGLLAYEYVHGQRSQQLPRRAAWPTSTGGRQGSGGRRAVLIALACLGPLASIGYAVHLERESLERRPMLVTAHRAGPKTAPENSLAALRLSIAAGADFAEIDVQQTADGEVVLMHDRDLRRMTGDPREVKDISTVDLAALRMRNSGAPTDEHVPTLAEMIAACGAEIRLNVELKYYGDNALLVPAVLDVLRAHDFSGPAIVSCLQLAPLAETTRRAPEIPVGMILSTGQGDMTRLPVNFLSLHQRLVNGPLVKRAHRRGMEVHVWGVSDREAVLRLLDLGCDNLITDDPAMVREVVDWYASLGDVERMLMRMRRWMRE
ncbi:MAG TPA: glycerophosphodiester phosphodiesterase family protein [Pirellulales bacterium]|nr:glycerophosphodiester phosphodiesterase family protein [Pirellulales bacterium]